MNYKQLLGCIVALCWLFQPGLGMATPPKKMKSHAVHHIHHATKSKSHASHVKSNSLHAKKTHRSHPIHEARASQPSTHANTNNIDKTFLPGYLLSSVERNLVDAVRNTIATLRYTAYKLGGAHIDPSHGVYVVDCSSYVDYILKSMYPHAFTNLTTWSGTEKPTTNDYYQYFTNLSDNKKTQWNTVDDVESLRPGDILVFRYKNKWGNERGGHVMMVMDKPIHQSDAFLVRVTDSAPAGHSTDTRNPRTSGIGIGTLLLKVDSKTYAPYAYAWKVGSRWERNVNFAMARPLGIG